MLLLGDKKTDFSFFGYRRVLYTNKLMREHFVKIRIDDTLDALGKARIHRITHCPTPTLLVVSYFVGTQQHFSSKDKESRYQVTLQGADYILFFLEHRGSKKPKIKNKLRTIPASVLMAKSKI